jgi:alpha-1,3-rhamnosyl/mannosyltransferase
VHITVEQAARALIEPLGWDLVVFLPGSYPHDERWLRQVRSYRAPVSGHQRLSRIIWEQTRLSAAARREGVELLHGPAYVLPRNWRGPSVVTVHDLLALTHPEWCTRSNVSHYRLTMPPSLRRASRIVATSQTVAAELRRRPEVDADRVRVIPLGVEEQFSPAPPAEVQRVRGWYEIPGPYLLTVGNLEPKKNLVGLLELFGRLVDEIPHTLVIAGRTAWGDTRPFRRALEVLPPERVKLLGYVPREALPALYSGADLYLQLSWYEGFGLPPLEAMACGVPVVVSRGGALPEIAGPGAVIVDAADLTETAQAVRRLLGEEATRSRQAQLGQAHAAQFTWARHAQGLDELYREVLGHG